MLEVLYKRLSKGYTYTFPSRKARTAKEISVKLDVRDVWIGIYLDFETRRYYICLVPMIVIRIQQ